MSRWTKPLAARLAAAYPGEFALLNAGITGNCLLYEPGGVLGPVFGEMGTTRFQRDVLETPGLDTVILEGVPSFAGEIEGELSTPTGTALIRHFAQDYAQQPPMVVDRCGYGIGKKDFGRLSAVRASLGEAVSV